MTSEHLQQLAENGNLEPLVTMLQGKLGVEDIVQGIEPLVPANDRGETGLSYSETLVSAQGTIKFLSYASILGCANDGFAGLDSIQFPVDQKTVYGMAYDVRTKMNTKDFVNLVPPYQGAIGVPSDDKGTDMRNPEISEDGIVIPHLGIVGDEDLLKKVHALGNRWSKSISFK